MNRQLVQIASGLMLAIFAICAASALVSAQTVDRQLWGFGNNNHGQSAIFNFYVPTVVMTDVKSFDMSYQHTLVLKKNGEAYAWGFNEQYQLAANDTAAPFEYTPVPMESLPENVTFVQFATGYYHSLGLTADGQVYGWGNNDFSQLGITNPTTDDGPQPITSLVNITKIYAAVNSSFAIDSNNNLYVWGANDRGQLGFSETTDPVITTPRLVSQLAGSVVDVACGTAHSLVITTNGSLYSAGSNSYGQCGHSDNAARDGYNQVELQGVTSIAAGGFMSFAISNNNLYSWGLNAAGALGLDSVMFNQNISTPTQVSSITNPTMVRASTNHAVVIASNGKVYSVGSNNKGQAGTGIASDIGYRSFALASTDALGNATIVSVRAGPGISMALSSNGVLYVWGQLDLTGLGLYSLVPRKSPSTTNMAFVCAGADFAFGIEERKGTLYGWGYNKNRQLNPLDSLDKPSPVAVSGLLGINITRCDVGGDGNLWHVLTFTNTSVPYVWGINKNGQLGDTNFLNTVTTPSALHFDTTNSLYTKISAGGATSFFMDPESGILRGTGDNHHGQLGVVKALQNRKTPTLISSAVANDKFVVSAAAGYNHTLYCTSNGTVYAFGQNDRGQVAQDDLTQDYFLQINATTGESLGPVANLGNVTAVYAGAHSSFAVTTSGLYAWGDNTNGALGLGKNFARIITVPTKVDFFDGMEIMKISSARFGNGDHTLVQTRDGQLFVFGANDMGQLGLGDTQPRYDPTKLDFGGKLVLDIAAGSDFSIVLTGKRRCINDCSGQGTCDYVIGVCTCFAEFFGDDCSLFRCPNNCTSSVNGRCDGLTGACICNPQYNGRDCSYRRCPNNCSNHGVCDRITGQCMCDEGYEEFADCGGFAAGSSVRAGAGMVFVTIAVIFMFL